jgi:hypothetical protein
MNRVSGRDEDALCARLRDGDPLGGPDASLEEERALDRIARRLSILEPAPVRARFAFAVPLAVCALLAAVAWFGLRTAVPPAREAAESRPATAAASSNVAAAIEPETRQLQFETAGGTRVVWVLDPRFAL